MARKTAYTTEQSSNGHNSHKWIDSLDNPDYYTDGSDIQTSSVNSSLEADKQSILSNGLDRETGWPHNQTESIQTM